MKNNLNGIAEFVQTVDSGSLTEAASKLRVSKAHVSRNLRALEERLGVTLLNRTTRQIALTEFGAQYYERCRAALAELDAAETEASNATDRLGGTIRATVAGAFGESILAPVVSDFLALNPLCNVELYFTSRLVNLLEEQFDLAFRVLPESDTQEDLSPVYRYKLVTCASPQYLAENGTPQDVSDLARHNCLRGTTPYWRFEKQGRYAKKTISGNWRSNNGHALVTAAKRGLGIIQVPDFYLSDALSSGDLVPILMTQNRMNMIITANFAHTRFPPLRVQMFHDYVRQQLVQE